jgi:hypothetical protein
MMAPGLAPPHGTVSFTWSASTPAPIVGSIGGGKGSVGLAQPAASVMTTHSDAAASRPRTIVQTV